MAWRDAHGLEARLNLPNKGTGPEPLSPDRLPLVICGPILRRTEPDAVTVWVALKKARTVTLRVYSLAPPPFPTSLREELQGTRETVRLGENLHVVAVTALPVEASRVLAPGAVFFYNLFFGPAGGATVPESGDDLKKDDIVFLEGSGLDGPQPTGLSYSFEHHLPSFSLPPTDLNKLRLIHGTCRRPQGPGGDVLPALDAMIDDKWPLADERPHLLLLNGDQIYADDVADTILFLMMDADKALLGWSETLPGIAQTDEHLRQGRRRKIVRNTAKFTTQDPDGHLLRLGEYFAMYLFTWSAALWPNAYPDALEVARTPPQSGNDEIIIRGNYEKERATVEAYRKQLGRVRRLLANVPVYMMFDDHDVTDDWNMVRDWCERVYKNPLSRRIVQNALAACAICQAWGNTPERFEAGQPGQALLAAVAQWSLSEGSNVDAGRAITRRVGIPGTVTSGGQITDIFVSSGQELFQLARTADALRWDYSIRAPNLEILMLDLRTRKEFTADTKAPAAHLGPTTLAEQVPLDDLDPDKLFVVVSSGNVFTMPLLFGTKNYGDKFIYSWWYIALWLTLRVFEWLLLKIDKVPVLTHLADPQKRTLYNPDIRDSWEPQSKPFESLLSRLARRAAPDEHGTRRARVLLLSGDVHFSWTARMQYWADHPFDTTGTAFQRAEAVFAQFTSSPLNKEEVDLGKAVHNWGYIPMTGREPGTIRWFGWRETFAIGGISAVNLAQGMDWPNVPNWMHKRQPPMLAMKEAEETREFVPAPDWRYRLDFLRGDKSGPNFTPPPLSRPDPSDKEAWLAVNRDAQARYKEYAQTRADGREIIGKNNFAELRVQWGTRTKLAAAMTAAANSFTVVSAAGLPAPPLLVRVGDDEHAEVIKVGAVDAATGVCSNLARAQRGSQAAAHAADKTVEVFRMATQTHWWLVSGAVNVQPLTTYTVSLDHLDPQFPKPKRPQEGS
jgi:hypothetical protein